MKSLQELSGILGAAGAAMAPLLYASLGGLLAELSGLLNIALEGLILIGAFAAAAAAGASRSLLVGLAAGAAASTLLAALFGLATLKGKANEFIAGLAANLLASGLAVLLSSRLYGTKGLLSFDIPSIPRLELASLAKLPILGELLFGQDALSYGSWLAAFLAWLLVAKSPLGLRLRAAGSNPKALAALGLSPERYRLAAILLSGLGCGLAGACLSLRLSAYVPGISSGRGWIALVAIYLGGRRPLGVLAACFLFAAADGFANYAQGFLEAPADFILALPYLLTLIALVAGAGARRLRGRD